MTLNKWRIKSSRKDPEYSVYEIEGKIVRAISEDGIDLLQNHNIKGFPTIKDFESGASDNQKYFEVEKYPFIIYPYELPFDLLKNYSNFISIF